MGGQTNAASRLQTVSAGAKRATYSYVANSPLVGQIGFTHNGAGSMATTKQHDSLTRLTGIASGGTGFPPVSFAYQYNDANQRTQATLRTAEAPEARPLCSQRSP